MANQIPDPRTFDSWEDAFQYPLPVVRKLEQQLRRNINENREKLRSLVGASYRDLLGTAERIIDMDEQMQELESHLGDIGKKCNARAVERASENQEGLMKARNSDQQKRHAVTARTKVLQNTLSAASRAIRKSEDALLVSKLLVLARLLHRSVSETADRPAIIEDLRRKLGTLRTRLLSYIEHALVRSDMDRTSVANSLCAYSLITSSAPKEVLRHFLQARFEQLQSDTESPAEADILGMLGLYQRTLLDARMLFPRLFADALSELSNRPLLQDDALRSRTELSLDIYMSWIPDDVRLFIPWVRHEQVLSSDVGDALASWAKQAQAQIHSALTQCLSRYTDAKSILVMRKKVLLQYLSLSGNLRVGSHNDAIDNVRQAFLERLQSQVSDCAYKLALRNELEAESSSAVHTQDLWQLSLQEFDMSHGAKRFRQSIVDRRHGRQSTLRTCVQHLDDWLAGLNSSWELTQEMRSTRWRDELDIDFEDLEDGEELYVALSKRDPEQLQNSLRIASSEVLQQQYSLIERHGASSEQPEILLRLVRELDNRRRRVQDTHGAEVSVPSRIKIIKSLHEVLAQKTAETPLKQYTVSACKKAGATTSLWDGSPALPVQPSPYTYRFLSSMQNKMSEEGSDVWSTEAVRITKAHIAEMLSKFFSSACSTTNAAGGSEVNGTGGESDMPNGVEHNADAGESSIGGDRDRLLQSLFDALYLQRVMASGQQTAVSNSFEQFVKEARQQTELDEPAHERLQKSANDYWNKTYLLFGLLAPRGS